MRYGCLPLILFLTVPYAGASTCTFTDWDWHSESQKAVNIRDVKMDRTELTPEQIHPTLPCSICREDQRRVKIGSVETYVCHIIANDIQSILEATVASGFQLDKLVGYRVGKTKGPVDSQGLRTEYSHHSFGLALDINPDKNGLYDRCSIFSSGCRLRRGGHWRPGIPGTVTPESDIYHGFNSIGLKWGGELKGQQKDFMHFSLSGD